MRTELWVQSAGKEFHYRSCVSISMLPTSARCVKEMRMNAAEMWMKYNVHSIFVRRIFWRGIGFINNLPGDLVTGHRESVHCAMVSGIHVRAESGDCIHIIHDQTHTPRHGHRHTGLTPTRGRMSSSLLRMYSFRHKFNLDLSFVISLSLFETITIKTAKTLFLSINKDAKPYFWSLELWFFSLYKLDVPICAMRHCSVLE